MEGVWDVRIRYTRAMGRFFGSAIGMCYTPMTRVTLFLILNVAKKAEETENIVSTDDIIKFRTPNIFFIYQRSKFPGPDIKS